MIIKSITPGDLRHMHDQEALILQGRGGDLTEWVEGINGILTEEEILKDGFRFEEAYTFKNEGLTCLMFPLEDGSKINMGKPIRMVCLRDGRKCELRITTTTEYRSSLSGIKRLTGCIIFERMMQIHEKLFETTAVIAVGICPRFRDVPHSDGRRG